MRERTPWDLRLILWPLLAAVLALFLWGKDYVAARGGFEATGTAYYAGDGIQSKGTHPASATPQLAAFAHKTCWIDARGLEWFCFELSEERR